VCCQAKNARAESSARRKQAQRHAELHAYARALLLPDCKPLQQGQPVVSRMHFSMTSKSRLQSE
jgi:hypothetical protein